MRTNVVWLYSGLLLTLLAGSALAGTVTPAMETYLAARSQSEPIQSVLILADRVDIKALDWDLHDRGVSNAERHYTVITTLQEQARISQGDLLIDLEARQQRGEIESYESFWIVNAVSITTRSVNVVRDLAARSDVDVAETPVKAELIAPTTEVPADKSRGVGITSALVNRGARRVWTDLGISGDGALVANLDTGVDGNHIALRDRWRGNHAPADECWLDFVGGFDNPPVDSDTHGTHTMGTICGLAVDDTIGVAPRAEWIAANTIAGGNVGNQLLQTLQWLADPDGNPETTDDVPDVANNSWGVNENFGYPDCYSGWWDAIDACEAAGVMHVWATGNEGPSPSSVRSPADRATSPYDCFSVGSTTTYFPYTVASSSSRGPSGANCGPPEFLIKPEVSAPGINVYSSIPGNNYTSYSGTSMATPHVAGTVALMRSANPELDVITIKQILMDTALDRGVAGEDNLYGHGVIDMYEAVVAAMSGYGVVDGTVVDDATGLPVADASVSTNASTYAVLTDTDGSFRLSLPAGATTLTATTFGYEDSDQQVDIPGGGEINPELRLIPQPSVELSGTIYGPGDAFPGGTPTVGVIVQLADTPLPAVTSSASGHWSIMAPRDAAYTVLANLAGVGSCTQSLPAMQDRVCDLYLRAENADGFESGDLSGMAWSSAGAADWEVTDDTAQAGTFAARSGQMDGGETSILNLAVTLDEPGPVTFWVKTSGSSTLAFWDGFATISSWSDQADWVPYTYEAAAGDHTFRWRYSTSSGGGGAGDRGYLDDVVLPGGDPAAPRAIPCPTAVEVAVPSGGTATASLLVLNQGVLDLTWSLSDALPNVAVGLSSGVLAASDHADAALTLDARGLADGAHVFNLTLTSDDPDNPSITIPVTLNVGEVSTPVGDMPASVALVGAMPNPFNPQTVVRFALPTAQQATLRVYDMQGRLVRELVDGVRPAGVNDAQWNGRDSHGRDVASGTYFARLVAGEQVQVKSMVLVR